MELTKEYFDKHYEELNDFLSQQFTRVFDQFDKVNDKFSRIDERFSEQSLKLDLIQNDIAAVRKDLTALSRRTKEDDQAFAKELLKLKNRVETLEKKLKAALKTQAA